MFSIQAKKRNLDLNLQNLRKGGETPAVFYGAKKENTPITIPTVEFKKVWRQAGESSPVEVELGGTKVNVLIHDVQVDPITSEPTHVDFLAIDMKKKVQVSVPIEFIGISSAVKSGIGNLVKVLHEVEVEALPTNLPNKLEADLSKLTSLDDNITVADIIAPKDVTIITDLAEIVASVVPQVEEKESPPVDISAIEVEKKGKKDEEASAGEVSA